MIIYHQNKSKDTTIFYTRKISLKDIIIANLIFLLIPANKKAGCGQEIKSIRDA